MSVEFLSLAIALASLALYLGYVALSAMTGEGVRMARLRALNARITQWPQTTGCVLRIGIDCEYPDPDVLSDLVSVESEAQHGDQLARAERLFVQANQRQMRYGGVLIAYEYQKDGRRYRSRSLSPVAELEHREWAYHFRRGAQIKLWIDPERPGRCFIGPNTEAGLIREANQRTRPHMWNLARAIALLCLALASLGLALA